jgi:hypothetical protein
MDITKLIEEINRLTEQDIDEITLQDEIEPAQPAQVIEPATTEPVFNDIMSLADQFDAKARIARALEALQAAVEEFKDATAEKIDLLQDQALNVGIEKLDALMLEIEQALASGSKILGDTELNDIFKPQLPAASEEPQEDVKEQDEVEEYDFEAEAGLDLLNPEE